MNANICILLAILLADGPDSELVSSEALAKASADLRTRLAAQNANILPHTTRGNQLTDDKRNCAAILLGDAKVIADQILEHEAEIEALQARIDQVVGLRATQETAIATAERQKVTVQKRYDQDKEDLQDKTAPASGSPQPAIAGTTKTTKAGESAPTSGQLTDPVKVALEILTKRLRRELSEQDDIIKSAKNEITRLNETLSKAAQRINSVRQEKSKLESSFDAEVLGSKHGGEHAKEHGVTGRRAVDRQMNRCLRQRRNERIEAQIETERGTFRAGFRAARNARCYTALCWGPSNKFAFEPLAELPVGKTFALSHSGLARYINGTDVDVSFTAGLRFWSHWDWFSIAIYLSKPLVVNKDLIHVSGSTHEFNSSQIRRPYPGLAIGLFGDNLWISLDYDQLRNGNSGDQRAPEFRPNDIVSHTLTLSVAIAPVTGFRNGIGLGTAIAREKREAAAAAATAAAAQKAAEAAKNKLAAEMEVPSNDTDKIKSETTTGAAPATGATPTPGETSTTGETPTASEPPATDGSGGGTA